MKGLKGFSRRHLLKRETNAGMKFAELRERFRQQVRAGRCSSSDAHHSRVETHERRHRATAIFRSRQGGLGVRHQHRAGGGEFRPATTAIEQSPA